jgi:diadenosine tetraphosphate (Ap4A) HIT family hydrolase
VGDALKAELGAYRINYETWGNLDPALHTHIVPRFLSEDPNKRVQTPRQAYDWGGGRAFDFQRDRLWMDKVTTYLQKRVSS